MYLHNNKIILTFLAHLINNIYSKISIYLNIFSILSRNILRMTSQLSTVTSVTHPLLPIHSDIDTPLARSCCIVSGRGCCTYYTPMFLKSRYIQDFAAKTVFKILGKPVQKTGLNHCRSGVRRKEIVPSAWEWIFVNYTMAMRFGATRSFVIFLIMFCIRRHDPALNLKETNLYVGNAIITRL